MKKLSHPGPELIIILAVSASTNTFGKLDVGCDADTRLLWRARMWNVTHSMTSAMDNLRGNLINAIHGGTKVIAAAVFVIQNLRSDDARSNRRIGSTGIRSWIRHRLISHFQGTLSLRVRRSWRAGLGELLNTRQGGGSNTVQLLITISLPLEVHPFFSMYINWPKSCAKRAPSKPWREPRFNLSAQGDAQSTQNCTRGEWTILL